MTCDVSLKVPALFDPLSKEGRDLLNQIGIGASGLEEAFKTYAKKLANNLKPLEAKLKEANDIFGKHYKDNADRAYKWLNETSAKR